jgi:hypothetical protein
MRRLAAGSLAGSLATSIKSHAVKKVNPTALALATVPLEGRGIAASEVAAAIRD